MADDRYELVRDLPAPWDELTVTQAVYLRHRVALVPHLVIGRRYGVSESAVRHALRRAADRLGLTREADLVVLAAREGIAPLPLVCPLAGHPGRGESS